MTDETEVNRGLVWSAWRRPGHYAGMRPAPKFEGFTIPTRRSWPWRRTRAGSGPRPLDQLLTHAEKAAQVRRSGTDRVLAELKLHRDSAPDSELKSALAVLCNTLSRLVKDPNAAHSRQTLMAVDAVKRAAP